MNSTHELEPPKVRIFLANETTFTLQNLNSSTLYKFYLSAKTIKGSGPFTTEEAFTVMETSKLLIVMSFTLIRSQSNNKGVAGLDICDSLRLLCLFFFSYKVQTQPPIVTGKGNTHGIAGFCMTIIRNKKERKN